MSEIMYGVAWIKSVLSADAPLQGYAPGGVWRSEADAGTEPPYVIIIHQSGLDVVTMNGFRLMDDLLYQVKVVGPASNTPVLVNAAKRIDALIGSPPTSGTVTGANILASYREQPLEVDEIVNGELWTNLGGLYRLQIQLTG